MAINKYEELQRLTETGNRVTVPFEIDGKTYIRAFQPRERLFVLGAGHIAQPVCRYAADLGFTVTVMDDRPDFANRARFPEAETVVCDAFSSAIPKLDIKAQDYIVIVTRGHRYDGECLRAILSREARPKYLGMIGSKRRVIELLNLLEEEGFSRDDLDRIYAPIGVDIHALTIKEIAISIVAQLIQARRETEGRQEKGTLLVMDDIDPALLKFLSRADVPKAAILVYETSGSTPAKAGAIMAVDHEFQTAGTIGGGCGEAAVRLQAYDLIGTGEKRCVEVDLSNDLAEEEGMVCGGRMKILIQDVGGAQEES